MLYFVYQLCSNISSDGYESKQLSFLILQVKMMGLSMEFNISSVAQNMVYL